MDFPMDWSPLHRACDEATARAVAAEAEAARLREQLDAAVSGRNVWRALERGADAERHALAADNARLRAIVEGRDIAPAPQDAEAHALAHPAAFGTASNGARCDAPVGLWLCVVDGEHTQVLALAREDDEGPYLMAWSSDYGWCGTGDIRHAWPLDRRRRPTAWPVAPSAEAATAAGEAGE